MPPNFPSPMKKTKTKKMKSARFSNPAVMKKRKTPLRRTILTISMMKKAPIALTMMNRQMRKKMTRMEKRRLRSLSKKRKRKRKKTPSRRNPPHHRQIWQDANANVTGSRDGNSRVTQIMTAHRRRSPLKRRSERGHLKAYSPKRTKRRLKRSPSCAKKWKQSRSPSRPR